MPTNYDHIYPGARVKCIHQIRPGDTATVIGLNYNGSFYVQWDNTGRTGTWSNHDYFVPLYLQEQEKQLDQQRRHEVFIGASYAL